MKKGRFPLDFGTFFFTGQSLGSGSANVEQDNRPLRNLTPDKFDPGLIVSHELNLDEAAEGPKNVDDRVGGWTTVLLHP